MGGVFLETVRNKCGKICQKNSVLELIWRCTLISCLGAQKSSVGAAYNSKWDHEGPDLKSIDE